MGEKGSGVWWGGRPVGVPHHQWLITTLQPIALFKPCRTPTCTHCVASAGRAPLFSPLSAPRAAVLHRQTHLQGTGLIHDGRRVGVLCVYVGKHARVAPRVVPQPTIEAGAASDQWRLCCRGAQRACGGGGSGRPGPTPPPLRGREWCRPCPSARGTPSHACRCRLYGWGRGHAWPCERMWLRQLCV